MSRSDVALPVLATDLDGTFLEGSSEDRHRLWSAFSGRNADTLIFASGRGLDSIETLLRSDPRLPRPAFIIGDVGATVVHGPSARPVEPLQREVDAKWPGAEVVRSALSGFRGLVSQDVPQTRRCSFFVDDEPGAGDLSAALGPIGCEALFSNSGRYLDVLPRGVSKGRTLQRLIALQDLDPAAVVVAGDSLNDLSLFETGYKGIVVGNAEPALVEAAAPSGQVYHACGPGASGIHEGLRHHGFLDAVDGG